MSRTLIPVEIRPHLIPWLFLEFPGVDANFMGKKVKAVKISTYNDMGRYIRLLIEKADLPFSTNQSHAIFISVNEREQTKKYSGKVYKYADGRRSFLELPKEGVLMLNQHLEGKFRTSLFFFMLGWEASNQSIIAGINHYIDRYRLLEFGFDPESLRRNYYRWKKEENRLSFLFNKASNHVKCR